MTTVTEKIPTILKLVEILSRYKFGLQNEKTLQVEIADALTVGGISFEREYRLDEKNIPDFFIDGTAIEVKIKGSKKDIYKQCERYSKFEQVKEILLLTNRSMGFPEELHGKPCYVLNLGKAWL